MCDAGCIELLQKLLKPLKNLPETSRVSENNFTDTPGCSGGLSKKRFVWRFLHSL